MILALLAAAIPGTPATLPAVIKSAPCATFLAALAR